MKPLPPIRAMACERADDSGSSGRGNGMRSMMTSWHAEPGTSTPCHRVRVPKRQVLRVAGELAHQRGDLVLALAEETDVAVEPLAHRLGGFLGRPHRGEQPERASARRPHQRLDLVEGLLAEAVAAGCRQVLRHVGDGLLRVVERAAHVEAAPLRGSLATQPHRAGHRIERAAELEGRRRHDDGAVTEDLVAQQHRDTHGRHPEHGAAALVAADPHDVEVALLEDPRGVLEHLVDGGLGHLAGAVGLDALLGLELRLHLPGRVPHPSEGQGQRVGYAVELALGELVEDALEEDRGVVDGVGGLGDAGRPAWPPQRPSRG